MHVVGTLYLWLPRLDNELDMSDVPSLFDLDGRVIVITGGYGDLGLTIARGLRDAGAKVVLIGRERRQACGIEEALHLEADVRCLDQVQRALDQVAETFGTITALINNAGVYRDNKIDTPNFHEAWKDLIDTNLTGAALCCRAAAKYFKKERYGKIVNIGSAYSMFGHHKSMGYTAAKSGLLGLTNALAAELGRDGIRANAILPGWFDTKMNDGVPGSERGNFIENVTPLGRWGKSDDITGLVIFLCASASDFISGSHIRIDGGYCVSDRDYNHI